MGKMPCKPRGEEGVQGMGEHWCEAGPTQCHPQSASNPERKSHKDKLPTPEVQHKLSREINSTFGKGGLEARGWE